MKSFAKEFIFILISICILSRLSRAETQYTFFINNKYVGPLQNGTLEFPFNNLSQSFPLINSSSFNLAYQLLPTDEPYIISLANLKPSALMVAGDFFNCSTFKCQDKALINLDLIMEIEEFNLTFSQLEIIDFEDQGQEINITGTSLVVGFSGINFMTTKSIRFTFLAENFESIFKNIGMNVVNLTQPLIEISSKDLIQIQIKSLNCTEINFGLFSITSSEWNPKSTFTLVNSQLISGSRTLIDLKIPPIFSLVNINNINITDFNFEYDSYSQSIISTTGSSENIVLNNISLLKYDYSKSVTFAFNIERENLAVNIFIDNINLSSIEILLLFYIRSESPLAKTSFSNFTINFVQMTSALNNGILALLFPSVKELSLNHWNITNSIIQTIFVFLPSQNSVLIHDPYHFTIEKFIIKNTTFFNPENGTIRGIPDSSEFILGFNNRVIYKVKDLQFLGGVLNNMILISIFGNTTIENVILSDLKLINSILFSYTDEDRISNDYVNSFYIKNNIFSNIYLDDSPCLLMLNQMFYLVFIMSENVFSNITGGQAVLFDVSFQLITDALFYDNIFVDGHVSEIISGSIMGGNYYFANTIVNNVQLFLLAVMQVGAYNAESVFWNNTITNTGLSGFNVILGAEKFLLHMKSMVMSNLTMLNYTAITGLTLLQSIQDGTVVVSQIIYSGIYIKYKSDSYQNYLIYSDFFIKEISIENSSFVSINFFDQSSLINMVNLNSFTMSNIEFINITNTDLIFNPIQITSSLTQIQNVNISSVSISFSNLYSGAGGFLYVGVSLQSLFDIQLENISVNNWQSAYHLMTFVRHQANLDITNFICNYCNSLFYLGAFAANISIQNVTLNNTNGNFLQTLQSSNYTSNIVIENYWHNLGEAPRVGNYPFSVNWQGIDMSLENVSIFNMPIAQITNFSGSFNLSNLSLKTNINLPIISFISGDYGISAIYIQEFIIYDSNAEDIFVIQNFSPDDMSVILSKGLMQNINGKKFASITDVNGNSNHKFSNLIFESCNLTFFSNKNANLDLLNIIYVRSYPSLTGTDEGFAINISRTSFENFTGLNIFSPNGQWLQINSKNFSATNFILSNGYNTLSFSNSESFINSSSF